jgi:DNA repair protein RadC
VPSQTESLVHRARTSGVASATTMELLAIGFSRREDDADSAENMARDLLRYMQKIQAIGDLDGKAISEKTGLEGFEVLRCRALIELGRRSAGAGKGDHREINSAADIVALLAHLRNEKKEHFCSVLLDAKHQVLRTCTVHIGTLTMSVVGPREIFRDAIREGASSIIVAHNHPSGDPTPSPEDINVTDKLKEVGQLLDIPLIDHVIIGSPGYTSFSERGLLDK